MTSHSKGEGGIQAGGTMYGVGGREIKYGDVTQGTYTGNCLYALYMLGSRIAAWMTLLQPAACQSESVEWQMKATTT